jgi:hypothetical protein
MGANRSGENANLPRMSSDAVAWLRPKVKTLIVTLTVNENLQYFHLAAHLTIATSPKSAFDPRGGPEWRLE